MGPKTRLNGSLDTVKWVHPPWVNWVHPPPWVHRSCYRTVGTPHRGYTPPWIHHRGYTPPWIHHRGYTTVDTLPPHRGYTASPPWIHCLPPLGAWIPTAGCLGLHCGTTAAITTSIQWMDNIFFRVPGYQCGEVGQGCPVCTHQPCCPTTING